MRSRVLLLAALLPWPALHCDVGVPTAHAAAVETVAPAPGAPSPIVEVVIAGSDPSAFAAMSETFKRSLGKLGAAVVVTAVAAMNARDVVADEPAVSHPGVAVKVRVKVWIDLGQRHAANVYVTEHRNVFARRLPLFQESDVVAADLLDVVVTSSVETVLSGRELGIPRQDFLRSLNEAPPAAPTPPATPPGRPDEEVGGAIPVPPPASRPPHLSIVGLYEGTWAGPGPTKVIHGPGLRIDAEWSRVRLGLGLHGRLPHDVAGGEAKVRFLHEGFRLSAGRPFALGGRTVLVLAVAGGLDLIHVHTLSTPAAVTPVAAFWTLAPLVRPFVELERRFGRVGLAASMGVDVDVLGSRYVVAGDPAPLWSPWRWRPVAAVVVRVGL
ncbi:MAG: hypothetical protein ABUS79_03370 [Pseudomonadota bacterium]